MRDTRDPDGDVDPLSALGRVPVPELPPDFDVRLRRRLAARRRPSLAGPLVLRAWWAVTAAVSVWALASVGLPRVAGHLVGPLVLVALVTLLPLRLVPRPWSRA